MYLKGKFTHIKDDEEYYWDMTDVDIPYILHLAACGFSFRVVESRVVFGQKHTNCAYFCGDGMNTFICTAVFRLVNVSEEVDTLITLLSNA